jgi:hypothetical protein
MLDEAAYSLIQKCSCWLLVFLTGKTTTWHGAIDGTGVFLLLIILLSDPNFLQWKKCTRIP